MRVHLRAQGQGRMSLRAHQPRLMDFATRENDVTHYETDHVHHGIPKLLGTFQFEALEDPLCEIELVQSPHDSTNNSILHQVLGGLFSDVHAHSNHQLNIAPSSNATGHDRLEISDLPLPTFSLPAGDLIDAMLAEEIPFPLPPFDDVFPNLKLSTFPLNQVQTLNECPISQSSATSPQKNRSRTHNNNVTGDGISSNNALQYHCAQSNSARKAVPILPQSTLQLSNYATSPQPMYYARTIFNSTMTYARAPILTVTTAQGQTPAQAYGESNLHLHLHAKLTSDPEQKIRYQLHA